MCAHKALDFEGKAGQERQGSTAAHGSSLAFFPSPNMICFMWDFELMGGVPAPKLKGFVGDVVCME